MPVSQNREETGQLIQRIPQDRIADRNGKGIRLSDKTEDCLTNLRIADDILLFSTSLERLREMQCELKSSTEAVGLGIHLDKTKILSNKDKVKTT